MMYDHSPKFSHVVLSTILAVILMGGSVWFDGRIAAALLIGSGIFFLAAVAIGYSVVVMANDERWDKMESFANTYARLDEETRAALGFKFPTLRYKMKRGEVREMFEDTGATADQFRLFLQTSNDKYISPKRDWQTSEKPPAVWTDIFEWLKENDYIIPDSAAGSVSWLWKGNAYRHLMAYWMAGHKPQNMSENVVYAYEEE